MGRVLKQSDTSVYVQSVLGADKYFLGDCVDIDSIPNPRGDISLIQCWNRQRSGHTTIGLKRGAPGTGTLTLAELKQSAASYMEQVAEENCPFYLYVMQRECGDAGIQNNWVRGSVIGPAYLTDDPLTNVANRQEDNESGHEFNVTFPPPRIDVRWLATSRRDTVEATNLNFVAALPILHCGDDCGQQINPCDRLITGASGGVAASANLVYSNDEMTTLTAAAVDPFAAHVNIIIQTGVAFENASGVYRWLVAIGTTVPAEKINIAYSDDGGATWVDVTPTALGTNGEFATGPKSMFALDREHIWIGTSLGNIFFSGNGGETWVDQDALAPSGGNDINAIHFVDENVGYAVGDVDTIIYTLDGGATWVAATATGAAVDLLSVHVFTRYHVLVGTAIVATGSLRVTYNGTTTWSVIQFTGYTVEGATDMSFANPFVGMIVSNTAGPLGSAHLTIDGGATWRELSVQTNAGFTSVWMCSPTKAYLVGQIQAATAMAVVANG